MTSWAATVPLGTGKSGNECAFRGWALAAAGESFDSSESLPALFNSLGGSSTEI